VGCAGASSQSGFHLERQPSVEICFLFHISFIPYPLSFCAFPSPVLIYVVKVCVHVCVDNMPAISARNRDVWWCWWWWWHTHTTTHGL